VTVLSALLAVLVAQAVPAAAASGSLPSPVATATSPPSAAASATPMASGPAGATPAASAPASAAPSAVPAGSASPAVSPSPVSPSPVSPSPASPSPASPSPAGSPAATPTPSPFHYRFVPRLKPDPAPGEPQILEVDLNDDVLRSRGTIDMRIVTNSAVSKVVSRGNGREGIVPQAGPGEFIAHGNLPSIPFIASGWTVKLQFIASAPDGRSTTVTVPVRLR